METLLALTVGGMLTGGIYFILRRSVARLILGLILISHAINVLIFTLGRLTRGDPAFIPEGAETITHPVADPLPQALILTAIVISFGVQSFAIVLIKRAWRTIGTDDMDRMRSTDGLEGHQ